jgi:hypothetical protein
MGQSPHDPGGDQQRNARDAETRNQRHPIVDRGDRGDRQRRADERGPDPSEQAEK